MKNEKSSCQWMCKRCAQCQAGSLGSNPFTLPQTVAYHVIFTYILPSFALKQSVPSSQLYASGLTPPLPLDLSALIVGREHWLLGVAVAMDSV